MHFTLVSYSELLDAICLSLCTLQALCKRGDTDKAQEYTEQAKARYRKQLEQLNELAAPEGWQPENCENRKHYKRRLVVGLAMCYLRRAYYMKARNRHDCGPVRLRGLHALRSVTPPRPSQIRMCVWGGIGRQSPN